jgi:tetratricopeptide (TPR) repeat protein
VHEQPEKWEQVMSQLPRQTTIAAAAAAYRAGQLDRAEAICRQLLKRNKKNVDALQLLGTIAARRYDHDEALKHYRKCVDARPREAHFHYLIGKIEALQGRLDAAIDCYDRALALKPGYPFASGWKAAVLERRGDYDAAERTLRPFLEAGTESGDMAEIAAKIHLHAGRCREAIAIARRHLADTSIAPHTRIALWFVTGRSHERIGEYDEAFEAYRHANETMDARFDPDEYVRFVDRIIDTFTPQRLHELPRARAGGETCVFIAGMPRSGTTLVEQIIDAHPEASGAGEIPYIERMVRDLPRTLGSERPYPECVETLTPRVVERLAAAYRQRIGRRFGRETKRVVNKSLENYRHLGIIGLLFPAARIVYCRRDPRDVCFSCFASNLLPATHPYACKLEHLGVVYTQHERLMRHWKAAGHLELLEVRYEELIDDLDVTSRRIIEFCGLPWDDRCLSFHESGRPVLTLSYDQVRQPIYRTSVGRWRHFERHLEPLLSSVKSCLPSRVELPRRG